MQVLNVEDDALSARAVELILGTEGHGCTTARLGADALELAQGGGYDLILLDVMLPDTDGFAVIEQLMAAGVDLPYVMVSGLVDQGSDLAAHAFGATPYVVKPIDRKNLLAQIDTALADWRNNSQNSFRLAAGWTEALQLPEHDRRRHRRFSTAKKATIRAGRDMPCTVTNISHDGAGIRLPHEWAQCPKTFELRLLSGPTHKCRTCWHERDRLGVSFSAA